MKVGDVGEKRHQRGNKVGGSLGHLAGDLVPVGWHLFCFPFLLWIRGKPMPVEGKGLKIVEMGINGFAGPGRATFEIDSKAPG